MKNTLKNIILVGIYALLVIPFIVGDGTFLPSMFFPYITGKAFAFRIIVEIILGLYLILIIKDKEFRPKSSWILTCAGVFTLVLLAADINAVAPFKAFWSNFERMEGWVTIVHLFAYLFVLASMLRTEKMWLWFFRANVAAGIILAITSIDSSKEVRFAGPLGNPIYISVYFLFIFFFALILWYKDVLLKDKIFTNSLFYVYLLSAALSFYVTYRTSRGVLLGAIGGLFIAAILVAIFEKQKKVIRQISIGAIVVVIIAVAGFFALRQTSFVKNNPTLSRLAEVSWSNVNGQARQYVWPMAIKGFKEKPILGWGQEGFNYVFNKYYDPRMYDQEQWFDRAHNSPLDFLVAGGILGLLSYLSLFGAALYLLWFRKNNINITERSLLTGLFVGYFFQGLFVFDNLASYLMFFTTLAYVHSRLVEDKEAGKAFNYFSGVVENEEYQNYILIPIIGLLTIAGVYFINVPAITANLNLIQALQFGNMGRVVEAGNAFKAALDQHSLGDSEVREQILSFVPSVIGNSSVSNQTKTDFVKFSFEEVDKQISIVPKDARYYFLAGNLLNNVGHPEEALSYVNQAIKLSPAKQTMRFELIQTLANMKKYDEALVEAKKAYDLDQNYAQAKTVYDEVLKLANKTKW